MFLFLAFVPFLLFIKLFLKSFTLVLGGFFVCLGDDNNLTLIFVHWAVFLSLFSGNENSDIGSPDDHS